jgi:isoquinoline 1-oxidoreductase beta subunit
MGPFALTTSGPPRSVRADGSSWSRRFFLQAAAATGLVVGFRLPGAGETRAASGDVLAPNAFVRIAPDDTVTVVAKHIEIGQGSHTGLATILAEELDADWAQMRVEAAPADAKLYNNLAFGPVQGTGGSTAMANSWMQLRKAGAAARAVLVAAAAREWQVPAGEITVEKGVVTHAPSGRRARFGELAGKAAGIAPPDDPKLKDPKDFTLIGTRIPRVDTAPKSDGSAIYTIDVYLPEMLTALIARPPRFGGKPRSVDAAAARQVKGVVDVVEVPAGVAVLAAGFWAARKGREALRVEWDESGAEKRGSAEILGAYADLAGKPGTPARREGDAEATIARASRRFAAEYRFPYLAHAPMEPLDCVVRLSDGGCEIWAGSQLQTVDQTVAAKMLGLPPEKVAIHTMLGGGSFGRRATPNADVVGEAVSVAQAIGGRAPVKLVWTREDDIRGGRYRPIYLHRIEAGLDAGGRPAGWRHRIVGQSILKGTPFEASMVKDGIDATSVEGARNLPYQVGDISVELHTTDIGVPVLWWRSVGSTHTAFSTETFIDELAHAAGSDPVEFRRALLGDQHKRHRAVLDLVAEKSGWGTPLPQGRARGIALHESFGTVVAQVAEVSLGEGGRPRVERVVCALDCGVAINPDVIAAQMEGGIGYGLGAALHDEITLDGGRVRQSNFDDYKPLRIEEMPRVEVHIVKSGENPTGVGEPGVPPIAPAVANALFQLTGERIRQLPLARVGA